MFEFEINEKGVLTSYNGDKAHVIIPSDVTSIGYKAFAGCSNLQDVTIQASVKQIGYYAFYKCARLNNFFIPESVTEIGEDAFESCTSLTSIDIPSGVKTIRDGTFNQCTSLRGIVIPESVTKIGVCAFYECTNIQGIKIPSSVIEIGEVAFERCTSLTHIVIPSSVTKIGEGAFRGCTSLKRVFIGGHVQYISKDTFSDCPHHLIIIADYPNRLRELVGDDSRIMSYYEYLSYYFPRLKRECLTDLESRVLYNFIARLKNGKIDSSDITKHDILGLFPSRKEIDIGRIMQCIGFNLDQFNLAVDLSISNVSLRDTLQDYMERNLSLRHLSMFRVAVGTKSFSFRTREVVTEPVDGVCRGVDVGFIPNSRHLMP